MALTTPEAALGTDCPDFNLPGVDGRTYTRHDLLSNFTGLTDTNLSELSDSNSVASLVMFICNHCPYVKAIEDRLIELGHFFKNDPVKIFAVCANDAEKYPDDSFENIQKRWKEKSYPFPYLYDDSQEAARAFGAVCTPDFFLYDSELKLAYRGRLDDSWKDSSKVQAEELKDAIKALLAGNRPPIKQNPSMGCSIKWKEIK
jgi:thiol-disulfide isomerase/thioredoxin